MKITDQKRHRRLDGGRPSLAEVLEEKVNEALRDTSRYGKNRQVDAHVPRGMFQPLPSQRHR